MVVDIHEVLVPTDQEAEDGYAFRKDVCNCCVHMYKVSDGKDHMTWLCALPSGHIAGIAKAVKTFLASKVPTCVNRSDEDCNHEGRQCYTGKLTVVWGPCIDHGDPSCGHTGPCARYYVNEATTECCTIPDCGCDGTSHA